jgi:hypothetical protein
MYRVGESRMIVRGFDFARLAISVSILAFSTVEVARADDFYLTPALGTLGASAKATYRWSSDMSVSGMVNGFFYNSNPNYSGTSTSARISVFDTAVLMNYHPTGGEFRLTGGIRYSEDKITGTVSNSGSSVGYTIKANKIQPYLGAGYALEIMDRTALDIDVGAYYVGTPTLSTSAPTLDSKINSALTDARSKYSGRNFYPVAQLGVRYRF